MISLPSSSSSVGREIPSFSPIVGRSSDLSPSPTSSIGVVGVADAQLIDVVDPGDSLASNLRFDSIWGDNELDWGGVATRYI